jgi:uncharacterized protein with GYD domain
VRGRATRAEYSRTAIATPTEGEQMPSYVTLMNWTDQGIKTFKSSVERYEAADAAFAQANITTKEIYWTVGAYDLVSIVEAPDDETLAAAQLALGAQGNIRTTTLRAFSADEMTGIIAKTP